MSSSRENEIKVSENAAKYHEEWLHQRDYASENDLQRALEQVKMTAVEARIIRDIIAGQGVSVDDMPSHPSEAFLLAMYLIAESKANLIQE